MKVALPMKCRSKINSIRGLEEGFIEFRKTNSFEQDMKSKVFMICATETKLKEIDFKLHHSDFLGHYCASFKLHTSITGIKSMQANVLINLKLVAKPFLILRSMIK